MAALVHEALEMWVLQHLRGTVGDELPIDQLQPEALPFKDLQDVLCLRSPYIYGRRHGSISLWPSSSPSLPHRCCSRSVSGVLAMFP